MLLKKLLFLIIILINSCLTVSAQQTVGSFSNTAESFNGYTLFAPMGSTETYLIDNCGEKVHSWSSTFQPGLSCYLLENGVLLRAGRIGQGGNSSGIVEMIDWNSNLLWSHSVSATHGRQHHDIEFLPNGNILLIVWDERTQTEVTQAGSSTPNATINSEQIIEIQPDLVNGGATVVWEWKAWDHLIQDQDSTKDDFGVVGQHPERIDINFLNHNGTDWLHINGVDYNATSDQVIISVHNFSELWIIDHSTSLAESAGSSGGAYGKGGDLLFRWGNPQAYDQGNGNDQKLFLQHHTHWIPDGLPDAGKIMVFNNQAGSAVGQNYSTVNVIAQPVDQNGNYTYNGGAYGPSDFDWTYVAPTPTDFYSNIISGAERLPNGNTLVCQGVGGRFFEVDTAGSIVWEYLNPINNFGPITQGVAATDNNVFRCTRYAANYPGFSGQTPTPQGYLEIGSTFTCTLYDDCDSLTAAGSNTICPATNDTILIIGSEETGATYAWYLNGVVMAGEDSSVLLTSTAGTYEMAVSGITGHCTSPPFEVEESCADECVPWAMETVNLVSAGNASSARLKWEPQNDAINYIVNGGVLGSSMGSWVTITTTNPFFTANGLNETCYVWRLKVVCSGFTSAWSSVDTFCIPSCSSPTNLQTQTNGNSATFSWDESPGAIGYILQAQTAGGNYASGFRTIITPGNVTSYTINNIPLGNFKWRVQSGCNVSPLRLSAYSSDQLFSISAACDTAAIYSNDTSNAVCFEAIDNVRKCYSNNIPGHAYGPFGGGNTLSAQRFDYSMCRYPEFEGVAKVITEDSTSQGCGGGVVFGVSMQGVNYSPFARLYWVNPNTLEENLSWHVEAAFILNMDINGGHVNNVSRYHYHEAPQDYLLNDLGIDSTAHSPLLGYAADGFPIYYKYLYTDSSNSSGGISAFQSSFSLKSGNRPGDGISAPNGPYDGTYAEDYEFIPILPLLDECGGRFAVTPEYPNGTYYYVLTDNWPNIPRCLKGLYVDNSFRIGPNCPSSTAPADCSFNASRFKNPFQPTNYSSAGFEVYPNPASDHLNIRSLSAKFMIDLKEIIVYDLQGKVHFGSEEMVETIETKSWHAGTYFLQATVGTDQFTQKFIVE